MDDKARQIVKRIDPRRDKVCTRCKGVPGRSSDQPLFRCRNCKTCRFGAGLCEVCGSPTTLYISREFLCCLCGNGELVEELVVDCPFCLKAISRRRMTAHIQRFHPGAVQ